MTQKQKIAWPRILAEGAAIIASILLAFWIDAWWEGREQDELGQQYLVGLREDFAHTESQLGEHIEFIAGVMRAAEKVLAMASGPDSELLSDSFSKALGDTYSINTPNFATPTYRDMINSGNLRLVRNNALRMKMAELISLLQKIDRQSDVINETYWLHHAPFMDKNLIVSEFGWYSSNLSETAKERSRIMGKLPQSPFDIDISAVRTREFWNLIYDLMTIHGDQLVPAIEARNLCRELLVILDEEVSATM